MKYKCFERFKRYLAEQVSDGFDESDWLIIPEDGKVLDNKGWRQVGVLELVNGETIMNVDSSLIKRYGRGFTEEFSLETWKKKIREEQEKHPIGDGTKAATRPQYLLLPV